MRRGCAAKADMDLHKLSLVDLQPSQFYVSREKIRRIEEWFDPADLSAFKPIPVKLLDGTPVMTDGHTRAVAALWAGLQKAPLCWDEDALDWDMYRACVRACRERDVHSPVDLLLRVVDAAAYHQKWVLWCDRMHEELEAGRRDL
jgi:hypothetical protein